MSSINANGWASGSDDAAQQAAAEAAAEAAAAAAAEAAEAEAEAIRKQTVVIENQQIHQFNVSAIYVFLNRLLRRLKGSVHERIC